VDDVRTKIMMAEEVFVPNLAPTGRC